MLGGSNHIWGTIFEHTWIEWSRRTMRLSVGKLLEHSQSLRLKVDDQNGCNFTFWFTLFYWTFYKVCYTPPLYFFKLVIAVFKLVPKSKRQFQQKESWNVDMLVILCLCLCRKRKYQTSHKSLNKCNNHDERNVTPLKIRILKTNSH